MKWAEFPKLPMFEGINAPSRIEVDIHDLEVEGAFRPIWMAPSTAWRPIRSIRRDF